MRGVEDDKLHHMMPSGVNIFSHYTISTTHAKTCFKITNGLIKKRSPVLGNKRNSVRDLCYECSTNFYE